ncbi:hypothetical protein [Thaumasiovibrio sp. DFM-14]|uniref:hypothetical protein n=1 Tax=Thaumasiovibrio sp. DFM-14 TaxID=3384792 RepID=UPI0039A02FC5
MTEELAKHKRNQLESRIEQRNEANNSILDAMGLALEDSDAISLVDTDDSEVGLTDRPKTCKECRGRGVVKPMFFEFECPACYGTGYDLSDPIRLIKWQKLCMEWAKDRIGSLKKTLYLASTTVDEREADSMEAFYSDSKYNKND